MTLGRNGFSSTAVSIVTGFICIAAVSFDNHHVRAQLEANRAELTAIDQRKVETGAFIPAVAGIQPGRGYVRYSLVDESRPTLLIVLESTCPYCIKSHDAWRRLASLARSVGVKVVWVSRDTIETASAAGGDSALDADIIADPTHLTFSRLAMWAVPRTVLVGADGRVRYAHAGQVTPESESELSIRIKTVVASAARGRPLQLTSGSKAAATRGGNREDTR